MNLERQHRLCMILIFFLAKVRFGCLSQANEEAYQVVNQEILPSSGQTLALAERPNLSSS